MGSREGLGLVLFLRGQKFDVFSDVKIIKMTQSGACFSAYKKLHTLTLVRRPLAELLVRKRYFDTRIRQ